MQNNFSNSFDIIFAKMIEYKIYIMSEAKARDLSEQEICEELGIDYKRFVVYASILNKNSVYADPLALKYLRETKEILTRYCQKKQIDMEYAISLFLSDSLERDEDYYLSLNYQKEIFTYEGRTYVRYIELKDCFAIEKDEDKALELAEDRCRDWIHNALKNQEEIPDPSYSCKADTPPMGIYDDLWLKQYLKNFTQKAEEMLLILDQEIIHQTTGMRFEEYDRIKTGEMIEDILKKAVDTKKSIYEVVTEVLYEK